jgi:hypothetical protein
VYNPSAIATPITAGGQRRCSEQPPPARAFCHNCVLVDLTRCRRYCSSEPRPFETKSFSRDRREFSTRVQHWLAPTKGPEPSMPRGSGKPSPRLRLRAVPFCRLFLFRVGGGPAQASPPVLFRLSPVVLLKLRGRSGSNSCRRIRPHRSAGSALILSSYVSAVLLAH